MATLHSLKIPTASELFFTSDYHLFHENVIKYDKRPFKDINEMHEKIIANHNEVVSPEDTVVYLGDISIGFPDEKKLDSILTRLNGKIHYIYGNHDKKPFRGTNIYKRFEKITDILTVIVDDDRFDDKKINIVCCHYPMIVWDKSHRGAWHLHGHCHGSLPEDDSRRIDVGIMLNNYYPFSYEQVYKRLIKKTGRNFDHHVER